MRANFTAKKLMTAALVAMFAGGVAASYKKLRWKNFAEVDDGRLYRSGQLSERQLEAAIQRYGLRRVICLNAERADRERALCGRLGVAFAYFPMPSDGRGAPEQFATVYQLINDPAAQPVLVHCNAGVARTGVAIALYRVLHDHWTTERAVAELRSFERRGTITPELQQHVQQVAAEVGGAIRR